MRKTAEGMDSLPLYVFAGWENEEFYDILTHIVAKLYREEIGHDFYGSI